MENSEHNSKSKDAEAKKQDAIRQGNLIIALDQAARQNPHSFLGVHLEEILEYEFPE